jgi:hypothetical protein
VSIFKGQAQEHDYVSPSASGLFFQAQARLDLVFLFFFNKKTIVFLIIYFKQNPLFK